MPTPRSTFDGEVSLSAFFLRLYIGSATPGCIDSKTMLGKSETMGRQAARRPRRNHSWAFKYPGTARSRTGSPKAPGLAIPGHLPGQDAVFRSVRGRGLVDGLLHHSGGKGWSSATITEVPSEATPEVVVGINTTMSISSASLPRNSSDARWPAVYPRPYQKGAGRLFC